MDRCCGGGHWKEHPRQHDLLLLYLCTYSGPCTMLLHIIVVVVSSYDHNLNIIYIYLNHVSYISISVIRVVFFSQESKFFKDPV